MSDASQVEKEDYISKQELLRRAGISYGQFYRWKRMGLIPEAWFERRSTFTGQATFLPADKVLPRIERILALKDRHGLEEIAQLLSPDLGRKTYTPEELAEMSWISERARTLHPAARAGGEPCTFEDVLCMVLIDELLGAGGLTDAEARLAAATVVRRLGELATDGPELMLVMARRGGMAFAAVHSGNCLFDEQTQIVAQVSLDGLIEQIKVRLGKLY